MKRDKWYPTKSSFICSMHFEEKSMYFVNERRRLLANAVPTIFDFPSHLQKRQSSRPSPKKRHFEEAFSPVTVESANDNSDSNTNVQKEHSYCISSPRKFKKICDEMELENLKLKSQLRAAQMEINKKKNQIDKYQKTINELNKKLGESGSEILNKFTGVLKELIDLEIQGGQVRQYTQQMRVFALTLHFYSAQAYRYLRKSVKLPHPRTLRQWASVMDGKPGFTEESFVKLKQEVQASSEVIIASLMFDEMAIKKDIVWDGKNICGYVDLGQGSMESDECPVASEALVFMVTALNRSWKIPVGYCLINGLSAAIKKNLIEQYLRKLHETGICIVGVVCDGTATNRAAMNQQGISAEKLQSWFWHPADKTQKIFCIFDAAHMLKLTRNLLAEKKILIDGTVENFSEIKWEYFEKLANVQEKEGLHAANKLRRQHLLYETQKMKVGLAAQTLSLSVAKAMLFCKNIGMNEFQGCESTVKFIKTIDLIFDLLNSCHPMGKGTKASISMRNKATVCSQIDECIAYLQNLKFADGSSVWTSSRKMPLYGFVNDLLSIKGIAENYVWGDKPKLKYLLTRRLSQDHLELFFSSLRTRGGHRNNPNAVQFQAAYKKCLIARVIPSDNGNCTFFDSEMLTQEDQTSENVSTCIQVDDHDYCNPGYQTLSLYVENVVEYIAGSIVHGISKKIKCAECLDALFQNKRESKSELIALKDVNNSLVNPSQGVVKLCKIAEQVFRRNEVIFERNKKNRVLKFQTEVMSMLSDCSLFDCDHMFTATGADEISHFASLVKLILKDYFTCRINYVCRKRSAEIKGKNVRQMFTKLILFKGQ